MTDRNARARLRQYDRETGYNGHQNGYTAPSPRDGFAAREARRNMGTVDDPLPMGPFGPGVLRRAADAGLTVYRPDPDGVLVKVEP